MKSLPVITSEPAKRPGKLRSLAVHGFRIALFLLIIATIHTHHRWYTAQLRGDQVQPLQLDQVMKLFPEASSLGDWNPEHGGQSVLNAAGKSLGFVVQTSPEADDIIGFSGPTNTLIGFGPDNRVVGMTVLRSGDTKEHLGDVIRNEQFMTARNDLTWQAASSQQVDAVSGATLTSMSISEGIALRLGGTNPASRFPKPITIDEVKVLLPDAASLISHEDKPSLQHVLDEMGSPLGSVFRTSPHADGMIGYQGPTDTLVALDNDNRVVGVAMRESFDNQPYVRYVQEDEYFYNIFKGFTLADLATLDMVDAGIEGVSGATKTSITVAEALIHTASEIEREQPIVSPEQGSRIKLSTRDWGTAAVVICGLLIALTHLRGRRTLRIGFQIVLIVYLGFINADMVSQALLVGWAQNGVPWQVAPALLLLTAAALACPIVTGRQVYCTHLCPFGSLQDFLRRVPLKRKVPRRIDKALRMIPALLLLLVVVVAMKHLSFSLVGIEPFDAFVLRIAGWATISVAAVGLIASMFVPMAYCHYGCPTGAMLGFLRWHGSSGKLTRRDAWATLLVVVAMGLHLTA